MSNLKNYLFTSESVSEGHPDKVSDRISDMVVDTFLSGDPYSRVACETLTTTNKVVLAGEVRGPEINKDELISKVRDCIKDIGYDQDGFTWKNATKMTLSISWRKPWCTQDRLDKSYYWWWKAVRQQWKIGPCRWSCRAVSGAVELSVEL